MSLLRSNCALNIQAIQSGVWHIFAIKDEEAVPNAPEFRLQLFSDATNERYRIALNKAKQKNSPFNGMNDNNSLLFDFIKDCLIEFGLKDWRGVAKTDLMSDKEISEQTIILVKELLDPHVGKSSTVSVEKPSAILEKMLGKDGVLRNEEGRAVYYDELIQQFKETYSLEKEHVESFNVKALQVFETDVPCTQRNIKIFLNEPRNELAFFFLRESAYTNRPFRSIMNIVE